MLDTLSAMYPGVKSVVWWSDAIPQVGLDVDFDEHLYACPYGYNDENTDNLYLSLIYLFTEACAWTPLSWWRTKTTIGDSTSLSFTHALIQTSHLLRNVSTEGAKSDILCFALLPRTIRAQIVREWCAEWARTTECYFWPPSVGLCGAIVLFHAMCNRK
jgi:hypothetical protein